jgi:hypothetical protein
MRLQSSSLNWGLCSQTPGIYRVFPARMESRRLSGDGRVHPSPAFPAAEPVARVASQHCPIPSGSGRLSINHVGRRLNQKAANGEYSLNFVSHVWGSPHSSTRPYHSSLRSCAGGSGRQAGGRPINGPHYHAGLCGPSCGPTARRSRCGWPTAWRRRRSLLRAFAGHGNGDRR